MAETNKEKSLSVVKRNGDLELFNREKLKNSISRHTHGLNTKFIDLDYIVDKVNTNIYDKVPVATLEANVGENIAYLSVTHPDHNLLAGRYKIGILHKQTKDKFSDVIDILYYFVHPRSKKNASLIAERVFNVVQEHKDRLDNAIDLSRDFMFDYFAFKTLERSYLLKIEDSIIVERPQYLFMRCALGIHFEDIDAVIETYDLLSKGYFIHASPTLFNAGTPHPQMSSW